VGSINPRPQGAAPSNRQFLTDSARTKEEKRLIWQVERGRAAQASREFITPGQETVQKRNGFARVQEERLREPGRTPRPQDIAATLRVWCRSVIFEAELPWPEPDPSRFSDRKTIRAHPRRNTSRVGLEDPPVGAEASRREGEPAFALLVNGLDAHAGRQ